MKSLVTLLHAEERFLPVLEQGLLAHDNALNLDGGLLESVACSGSFFLLGDKLGLIEGLLLIKTLDLLIHGVNQQILLLLGLFKVSNVLLSAISGPSCDGNFRLHHLVILLDLLKSTVELIELFLGLQDTLELLIGLLLLAFILSLEDFMLALSLSSVPLDNVVVVVSALESGLHARQLMLDAVKLYTCLFTLLANLSDSLLGLTEFEIDTFVLIRELFGQRVLHTRHQRLSTKKSNRTVT